MEFKQCSFVSDKTEFHIDVNFTMDDREIKYILTIDCHFPQKIVITSSEYPQDDYIIIETTNNREFKAFTKRNGVLSKITETEKEEVSDVLYYASKYLSETTYLNWIETVQYFSREFGSEF